MIVRRERGEDAPAIADVHRRAFGEENVAQLVELIRASDRFVPELSLVAEDGGDVVGHVLLSHVTFEPLGASGPEPHARREVLTLSPVGVLPEYQRRGVGAALIAEALERARRLGEELVVLEGIPAYYPRFGFVRASTLGIDPPRPVPDEAWMALPLVPGREWRGRVVYPPAFDVV